MENKVGVLKFRRMVFQLVTMIAFAACATLPGRATVDPTPPPPTPTRPYTGTSPDTFTSGGADPFHLDPEASIYTPVKGISTPPPTPRYDQTIDPKQEMKRPVYIAPRYNHGK